MVSKIHRRGEKIMQILNFKSNFSKINKNQDNSSPKTPNLTFKGELYIVNNNDLLELREKKIQEGTAPIKDQIAPIEEQIYTLNQKLKPLKNELVNRKRELEDAPLSQEELESLQNVCRDHLYNSDLIGKTFDYFKNIVTELVRPVVKSMKKGQGPNVIVGIENSGNHSEPRFNTELYVGNKQIIYNNLSRDFTPDLDDDDCRRHAMHMYAILKGRED